MAYKNFEQFWTETQPSKIGRFLQKKNFKIIFRIIRNFFPKDLSVLDFGCGIGRTMTEFNKNGFTNVFGFDTSRKALDECIKKGFKNDRIFSQIPDIKFDIVFSDGVLEHYENMDPIIEQHCNCQNKYVVINQPTKINYFCARILRWRGNYVPEYHHNPRVFIKEFEKYNFEKILIKENLWHFLIIFKIRN